MNSVKQVVDSQQGKNKKRQGLLQVLVCSLMLVPLLTCLSLPARALTTTADGAVVSQAVPLSPDTSWYVDTLSSFSLTSAQQLAGLSDLVRKGKTFEGKTITLANNIDLGNAPWIPIGSFDPSSSGKHAPFMGTFDGAGKTVSQLYCTEKSTDITDRISSMGFFGYVFKASIKNVHIQGFIKPTDMSNSIVRYVGGVSAVANYSDIRNCTFAGTIDSLDSSVGGIVGSHVSDTYASGGLTIQNCSTSGVIGYTGPESNPEPAHFVGGIIGDGSRNIVIKNCTNGMTITTTKNGVNSSVGGIMGHFHALNPSILDCTNNGNIITGSAHVGGIVGLLMSSNNTATLIANCLNTATISSSRSLERSSSFTQRGVGGIVGTLGGGAHSASVTFLRCGNTGSIAFTGSEHKVGVGGLLGADDLFASDTGAVSFTSCFVNATVANASKHKESAASGMIGITRTGVPVLKGCYIAGSVGADSGAASAVASLLQTGSVVQGVYYAATVPPYGSAADSVRGSIAQRSLDALRSPEFLTEINAKGGNFIAASPGTNNGLPVLALTPVTVLMASNVTFPEEVVYNGMPQMPQFQVRNADGQILVEGVDYTKTITCTVDNKQLTCVKETDFINAETYNISLEGKGAYTGTIQHSYKINARDLNVGDFSLRKEKNPVPYSGNAATFDDATEWLEGNGWVIRPGDLKIEPVSSGPYVNKGKYQVRVSGGNRNIKTIIAEASTFQIMIGASEFSVQPIADSTYTGAPVQVSVNAVNKGNNSLPLTFGTDFFLTGFKQGGASVGADQVVEVGVYSAVLQGRGNYKGTWEVPFRIVPGTFEVRDVLDASYTGKPIRPTIDAYNALRQETVLQEGTDFSVTFVVTDSSGNMRVLPDDQVCNAGTYTVMIQGLGTRYQTECLIQKAFTITKKNFSFERIWDIQYTGSDNYPELNGTKDQTAEEIARGEQPIKLEVEKDFTCVYEVWDKYAWDAEKHAQGVWKVVKAPLERGTYRVTITGVQPAYTGTIVREFAVVSRQIATADVTNVLSYTSAPLHVGLKVCASNGAVLSEGTDYTVRMIDSTGVVVPDNMPVNAGSYTVTVQAQGNYTGVLTTPFQVLKARLKAEDATLEFSGFGVDPHVRATASGVVLPQQMLRFSYQRDGVSVSGADAAQVGTYDVTVSVNDTFASNFEPDATQAHVTLTITPALASVQKVDPATYDGFGHNAQATVVNETGIVINPRSYKLTYYNRDAKELYPDEIRNAGMYIVEIVPYKAESFRNTNAIFDFFFVLPATVRLHEVADMIFTGKPLHPEIFVTMDGVKPLSPDMFTVKYYRDRTKSEIGPDDIIWQDTYAVYVSMKEEYAKNFHVEGAFREFKVLNGDVARVASGGGGSSLLDSLQLGIPDLDSLMAPEKEAKGKRSSGGSGSGARDGGSETIEGDNVPLSDAWFVIQEDMDPQAAKTIGIAGLFTLLFGLTEYFLRRRYLA